MEAAVSVTGSDLKSIRKLLVNYRRTLDDVVDGPSSADLGIYDNLLDDEKDRVDEMVKKLEVAPKLV